MHEQTTVVPLALGDGVTTNLTVHLHLHVGPAVSPVNGEPVRTPAVSPVPTVSQPAIRRQLSPPKPEPIGHPAGDTTTAPTDVANAAAAILTKTGFTKHQARQAIEAAIEQGANTEQAILRVVFQHGRAGAVVQSKPVLPLDDRAAPVEAQPTEQATEPKPDSPEVTSARDECKAITAQYARLTPHERQVFDLRHAGVGWREIGQRLGITEVAAQRRERRLKHKLGKAGVAKLRSGFAMQLSNRGSQLCVGCHFNCAKVFGLNGPGGAV